MLLAYQKTESALRLGGLPQGNFTFSQSALDIPCSGLPFDSRHENRCVDMFQQQLLHVSSDLSWLGTAM